MDDHPDWRAAVFPGFRAESELLLFPLSDLGIYDIRKESGLRCLPGAGGREFEAPMLAIGDASLPEEVKPRQHPNRAEKRALKTAELARFVRQAGRKAQKNTEPNDRRYDHALQRKLRQIPAEELDRLLRDDEED